MGITLSVGFLTRRTYIRINKKKKKEVSSAFFGFADGRGVNLKGLESISHVILNGKTSTLGLGRTSFSDKNYFGKRGITSLK